MAASVCAHEAGPRHGTHFGHHVHACSDDVGQTPDGKRASHADCAACHAATPGPLTDLQASACSAVAALDVAAALPAFSSALSRAPDRPQWMRLV